MEQAKPSSDVLTELGLTDEVVTGEAVLLDLRPASFASRALAILLDLVVQGAAAVILAIALAKLISQWDDAAIAAGELVLTVTVLLAVPVTIETLTRGRSLGKLAAGLRVVRDDGGPIRFRQALVRGLLAMIELYGTTGAIALIASISNSRGRRLGDMLAGTFVIRVRAGGVQAPPVLMPPMLAGWADAADIGRIPDPLALAVRQFLARSGAPHLPVGGAGVARTATLHPASRARLGLVLAAQVGGYVAPPPPPGTPPELFLAAVLAQRRERDYARLCAERSARLDRERRRAAAPLLAPGSTALAPHDLAPRYPTTQGPTTQGPTTQGPTTQGPTTQGPTTQGPTTQGSTAQYR